MSRRVEDLTPRMQVKINMLLKRLVDEGLQHFKISCTSRTQEEQNAIYCKGRYALEYVNKMYIMAGLKPITQAENRKPVTWTKNSIHIKNEAVDFFISLDGKYCEDLKVDVDKDKIPDWKEFGKIAEECGLEWGGRWSKPDYPHVQWRD